MNINLIKSELEKLSLMLSSWEDEQGVSAIERDIALDKLKRLYDLVRFDSQPQPTPVVPTTEPEQTTEEPTEEEKDVEVELIFAEDEDMFTLPTAELNEENTSNEETDSPISLASEILASAIGVSAAKEELEPIASEPAAQVQIQTEEADDEVTVEEPTASEPEVLIQEVVVEQEVTPVEVAPEPEVEPIAEPIATIEPEPTPEPEPEPEPIVEKVVERDEPRSLNNLFGMEEVKRRPRTKHQRMMSIYSDNEPRQEKVVDISKIFNMEIDAPIPMTSKITDFTPEPEPMPAQTVAQVVTPEPEVEIERPKTLADAISPSTQTLADTLAAPTALGEEIHNSRIASLRDGIGLNDKFLMIRDLFDGDGDAYNKAIAALDELETMDDCIIHIIENYEWNPDSEGSKFIMQLLERKLS